MTSRTSRPEDLLVPSAASSRELGEEESGVRARSAESRAAESRALSAQLERETRALVQGLEGVRFAFNGRSGAAVRALKGRAQALAHVRDGLLQVLGASASAPRLFRDGSAFVDYLRGVVAWAHATLEAIGENARALGPGVPHELPKDLTLRVELAKGLHFDDLVGEVEDELRRAGQYDPEIDAVRSAMARLVAVARALEAYT